MKNDIEAAILRAFCGPAPRCQACGERDDKCEWRPAYQMVLCPACRGENKPTERKK